MNWKCPKCDYPNLMEWAYCRRCGHQRPGRHHRLTVRARLASK